MKSLYELTQEQLDLKRRLAEFVDPELDPETGEIVIDESLMIGIIQNELTTEEKIISFIQVIEDYEFEAEVTEAEWQKVKAIIERRREARDRANNAIKRIKNSILRHMLDTNQSEIAAGAYKIKVQNNPESVQIAPNAQFGLWPDDLYVTEYKPDKKAIKAHVKGGGDLPHGCEIIRTKRIVIK